jgi:glycosyltransferase involved in cell wall biosynthesis
MTSPTPRVTVGLPVYNGARYLGDSIRSVLDQTFEDFELIICDNCSSDRTPDVVRRFDDPRIIYVRHPKNIGGAANTNRCVELARGEYVGIWHHDDVMLPANLEQKVRVLDEHPSVGYVHSDLVLIDAEGTPMAQRWNVEATRDYVEPGLQVFHRYAAHMPIGALIFIGNVLMRRSCYQRLGLFRLDLPDCYDSEMWLRMALYYDVACLRAPLIKWRLHQASGTHASEALRGANWIRQHYAAVRRVVMDHGHRIPQCDQLWRELRTKFADKALKQSKIAFHGRDVRQAGAYLSLARRISPAVMRRKAYWSLAIRLKVGAKGRQVLHSARSLLRGV